MTTPDGKEVLLLVDDDPENIRVVHSILDGKYKIRVAMNGARALELARIEPVPDLILLDVMMPNMNGYEACSCLKADQRTQDIPVIFLTGKTDVADETRGFEVGAVDYIHKPFSPPVISARVRTHLMLREAHKTIARQLSAITSELEMARQIQLSILPQEAPHVAGLEIEARYLPMSSVAGDFYDFLEVDDKHIGVLIADVSGHGLPSALIASMLHAALAAQTQHASDPAQTLSGLNQALHGRFTGHYVTAAYLFIDVEEGIMHYAAGAHPPLIHWRASTRKTTECSKNGLMLGPFPDPTYTPIAFSFEKGDRIVLMTDGILEAREPSGEEFGMERLRNFVESNHTLPIGRLADSLLEHLSSWSTHAIGPEQSDDITLLAIDFKGLPD